MAPVTQELEKWERGQEVCAPTLRGQHRYATFYEYLQGERYAVVCCHYNKGMHTVEALTLRKPSRVRARKQSTGGKST